MDPSIKWYQKKNQVIITVDLKDIVSEDITLNTSQVLIKCTTENKKDYFKELNLNHDIDTEKSKWENDSELKLYLFKKEEQIWNKLTKEKLANVFIDWSNWNFIDEVPSDIKDNIVNNNIKQALASMNIPTIVTNEEMINNFNLSDSD